MTQTSLQPLHPNQKVILALLIRRGAMTIAELIPLCGLKERSTRENLRRLEAARLAYVIDWHPPASTGRRSPVWAAGDKKSVKMPAQDVKAKDARYRAKHGALIRARSRMSPPSPFPMVNS